MPNLKKYFNLLRYVLRRYIDDGCSHSAAALTYMSLFAVVPLMTVMYAILSATSVSQEVGLQIHGLVFDNFVPSTGREIENYLLQFSQQARQLTGVGIAFLGITAVLMLKNIEKTFNLIWKTRGNRRGLSSFLLYWAILSLGPIFIGLALGISTYLTSLTLMFDHVDTIGIEPHLLRFTPYLLISAAFTLLFSAVPNCHVPIKNAFIGGLITALVFEAAKQLFASIVSNTSYQLVYGTFAAIPLFLLWIYLSWLIVLAGAEFVQALNGFSNRHDEDYNDMTLSLAVLELMWRKHQKGDALAEQYLLRQPWLFDRFSISADRWTPIRDRLIENNLLRTEKNGDFVLGRDLNHYSLWDLYNQLRPTHDGDISEHQPQWFMRCSEQLANAKQLSAKKMSTPLAQLFSA